MPAQRLTTLIALAFSLAIAAPAPAGAASCTTKARAHFVGLGGGDSLNAGPLAGCVLAQQARAGAGVLRQGLDWKWIERSRGHYDFSVYDAWVGDAARHGFRILPILSNPPGFRAHNTAKYSGRPSSNTAFANYAAAVVRRYGPKGSFWTGANRPLRKYAIHSWQVWNEPNLPQYWGGHPSAKQYTALLKAAAKAIHKVDRKADVVTGGLPDSLIAHAIPAHRYVPQLYKYKAQRWFSTLAVNPYAHSAGGVVKLTERFRSLMVHHRDRADGLWVTEIGWGSGGPKSRFNLGSSGQARQLKSLLPRLYRLRRKLKLRGVVWYGWMDKTPYPPAFKQMWGLHTGLRTTTGKAKPAYKAFAKVAPKLK